MTRDRYNDQESFWVNEPEAVRLFL